jgi:hypothetical protein
MMIFSNLRECMGTRVLVCAHGTPRVRLWEGVRPMEVASVMKIQPLCLATIALLHRPVVSAMKNATGAKRVADTAVATATAAVPTASTALAENLAKSAQTVRLATVAARPATTGEPVMLMVAAWALQDIAIVLRGIAVPHAPSVGLSGSDQNAGISAITV